MSSSHKRYSREFKLEVVRRVLVTGQRQIGVAEELGIAPNTLSHWMRQFRDEKAEAFPGKGTVYLVFSSRKRGGGPPEWRVWTHRRI